MGDSGQAAQQALIEAAAAKAARKLRLRQTHTASIEVPNNKADYDKSPPSNAELAPVRSHSACGPPGDPDSDDKHERLLNAGQVRRRYGNASDMWLWRRLHDSSGFPQPIVICGRRFWKLCALVEWERGVKGEA
jgi:hypothetical protein